MQVTVHIEGLNKLIKLTERFPETAEKYVNKAVNRSLLRISGEARKDAPFGVGGLLRLPTAWRITMGRLEGKMESTVPYAVFVHEGTGPHMPPIAAIMPWAKKHGINPWAVAMSIKKKGTKANPFLTRAIDETESGIEGEFEKAMQDTLTELTSLSDA